MITYNYYENMKSDVLDAIEYYYDLTEHDSMDDAYDSLYDDLLVNDGVTGNASGSYTFSTYTAEENLCHNMDLLVEACNDFGLSVGYAVENGAEYCDVTIRCYLLGSVLSDVLDELNDRYEYWE